MSLFGTLAAIGTVVGNVGGAIAASVLPASIGGGAAGAGGIGAMTAATTAGTAGSALAGTAAAPAAATTALGNLAAAGEAAGTAGTAATTAAPSSIAAGAAPNTAAGAVEAAGLTSQGAPVAGAVPASSGSGITSAGISAPGGMLPASSYPAAQGGLGGIFTMDTAGALGKEVAKEGVMEGLNYGINTVQANAANTQAKQDMAMADIRGAQQTKAAEEDANKMYGPAGGLGGGRGLGMNEGGGVRLKEGQFIIPADVVSALGNGSTKAGASFLDDFFAAG